MHRYQNVYMLAQFFFVFFLLFDYYFLLTYKIRMTKRKEHNCELTEAWFDVTELPALVWMIRVAPGSRLTVRITTVV